MNIGPQLFMAGGREGILIETVNQNSPGEVNAPARQEDALRIVEESRRRAEEEIPRH